MKTFLQSDKQGHVYTKSAKTKCIKFHGKINENNLLQL